MVGDNQDWLHGGLYIFKIIMYIFKLILYTWTKISLIVWLFGI